MATIVFGISKGGIGSSIARLLRSTGSQVHIAGRNNAVLGALSSELGISSTLCDVTDENSIETAVSEAIEQYGSISGLAYCAGNIQLKPIAKMTPTDMQQTFAINVVGACMAVKHAKKQLSKSNGSVVLFSSVAARQGFPMHADIGTSKAAVEGI
jgi:NAD(P)-dependent dehydrogenase (short-subunit alcohol dehydrogenase family)